MKWKQYKEEWESEHPNEKPPKTRFEIMNEFMKEKFAAETEEMKSRCEELPCNILHWAYAQSPSCRSYPCII